MTIFEILTKARILLPSVDNPRFEVELLLAHVLNLTRSQLIAYPENQIRENQLQAFNQLLKRRMLGEPIAYLLAEKEFWSMPLKVTPATLIPRPETECLVEAVLEMLTSDRQLVADLGTGSGAIALALAKERPNWQLIATDQSEAALVVARENAEKLGIRNIQFYAGNWCQALPSHLAFDAIVSNPPYIAENDTHLGQGDLAFEPYGALVGGKDGTEALQQIIAQAPKHLLPSGWLFLEHGWNQSQLLSDVLRKAGFEKVFTKKDLAGIDRVLMASKISL